MLEEANASQDIEEYGGDPAAVEEKGREWLDKVEQLLVFTGKAEIRLAQQDIKFSEGMEVDQEYFKVWNGLYCFLVISKLQVSVTLIRLGRSAQLFVRSNIHSENLAVGWDV